MRTITKTVISGAADESQLGGVITASYLSQASATISVVDGDGIVGTVKWRQSNDGGVTFSDIPGAVVAIAGNGTYTLGPTNFACDVLQAVYTHAAGTGGTITANAHATGPSASSGFAPAGDLSGDELTQVVIGLQGRAVSSEAPTDGEALKWDATAGAWVPGPDAGFSAGGDLSGSDTAQTVIGLRGRTVSATAPSSGQVLKYDGTAWAPGADNGFTAGGDLSGTSTSQTVAKIQGRNIANNVPDDGDILRWSSIAAAWAPSPDGGFVAGGDLGGTAISQTVTGLQGRSVSNTAPSSGEVLKYNGSAWAPGADASFTAGGDLSGTSTSQTVAKIQGRDVSNTAPSSGQMLAWNGSAWTPTDAGGSPVLTLATGETTSETTSQVIGQITAATGIVKSLSSVVLSVTGYVAVSGADLVVELYDLTSSTSVKTVTVSSTSPSTVTSAAFSLTSGHVLELRFRRSGGSGNVFAGFVGIQ